MRKFVGDGWTEVETGALVAEGDALDDDLVIDGDEMVLGVKIDGMVYVIGDLV